MFSWECLHFNSLPSAQRLSDWTPHSLYKSPFILACHVPAKLGILNAPRHHQIRSVKRRAPSVCCCVGVSLAVRGRGAVPISQFQNIPIFPNQLKSLTGALKRLSHFRIVFFNKENMHCWGEMKCKDTFYSSLHFSQIISLQSKL